MTATQAVYDTVAQAYVERPFQFNPTPLLSGRQLDNDIDTYLECATQAGVMPNAPSLLFMGDRAQALYLRRSDTHDNWDAFKAKVLQCNPLAAARNAALIARVVALAAPDRSGTTRIWRPTTPEACFGVAALDVVPPGITIVADAPLPGGRGARGHVQRCDYHFASLRHELRVEIAGLLNSDGRFPTFHGVKYAQERMPARNAAYAALGLPPPLTLYADEVLDRSRLLPIIAELVSRIM